MSNFNLDIAVQNVKTIVDNNKCTTCDLLSWPCVRYPCGHTVCKHCAETAENCLLCLTPPAASTHIVDETLSCRIEHISNLLHTFQDLFNINVYRQHRLSEQLKLEKQVFPTCIQAPSKYCNKRRSLNVLVHDKENVIPFLPGENISYSMKMEKSIRNVQQWLNRNEKNLKESRNLPRKPFADLDVNDQNFNANRSVGLSKDKYHKISRKKRTHNKIINPSREKLQLLKKDFQNQPQVRTNVIKNKNEFNESGIIINDDDVIVIDETLMKIDKDKQAWLAVLEADKNKLYNVENELAETSIVSLNNVGKFGTPFKAQSLLFSNKVPFLKKGLLKEICYLCHKEEVAGKYKNDNNVVKHDFKNITIIIDSSDYTTTIKISDLKETNTKVTNKQCVKLTKNINCDSNVKADSLVPYHGYDKNVAINSSSTKDIEQTNILKDNAQIFDNNNTSKRPSKEEKGKNENKSIKGVVIEESETDSDSGNGNNNTLEVTAEVHRSESFDDFGILSTLEPEQYQHRKRIPVRSRTPLSTDSSDKENYDPNRAKRQKINKKCYKK